ncbi:MAG: helix-turn-helix transcriptional regulator [Gemmatimonadetes bacterium]|nr:helix-turn-helix transcriptional regulator [Gemmatimonadota bacterium]NNK61935.1 helix-turn-helix transcriptional regulator [Gemmatimonadota bacterium]
MSASYGQYCPLSLAAELLTRRWTILVISRVIDGCTRFNEIHRGVPQMSPSLLSRRLDELLRAGILEARRAQPGGWREYSLTDAGQELGPLVDGMAVWGQRWAREMSVEDLDPAFLVWSMHTRVDPSAFPDSRVVVEFQFTEAPDDCDEFWLVNDEGAVTMCLKHPGHDVDLRVSADLRVFIEAWRGFRNLRSEIRAGRIQVRGRRALRQAFPDWLLLSALAEVPRMRPGRERRLSRTTGPRTRPS